MTQKLIKIDRSKQRRKPRSSTANDTEVTSKDLRNTKLSDETDEVMDRIHALLEA